MTKSGAKSYDQLKSELDEVMAKLQQDDLDVDQAVDLYKTGLDLVNSLEKHLKSAENKITELKAKFDNQSK